MKWLFLFISCSLFSLSALAQGLFPDFQWVNKSDVSSQQINEDQVVFETDSAYILKSTLTNFVSYDYYFIQWPENKEDMLWFLENTDVVLEKQNDFIISRIQLPARVLEVSQMIHRLGSHCGMIQKIVDHPIALQKQTAAQRVFSPRQDVRDAIGLVEQNRIIEHIQTLSSWQTRYHDHPTGTLTGEKLLEIYRSLTPEDRKDVEFELVNHQDTPQKSLVVRIIGQKNPEQIVIVGNHIDSINSKNHDLSPGADDDGSGTATNLEAFRSLMASGYRPEQTIEIHGYAAEEIGLVGSGEMARAYRNQSKNVLAMVQIDMNGYTRGDVAIHFVRNKTDSSLTRQLQELVDLYLDISYDTGFLFFGSSDHASWDRQGFPVAFPTEDPQAFNRKIHTQDDTLDYVNSPEQMTAFTKMVVAYLMHFSS